MTFDIAPECNVFRNDSHWVIKFPAMASPCEILVRCRDRSEAEHLASLSFSETHRIERKLSRYRRDNTVHDINCSNGMAIEVDEELHRLLDYADQCYHLSSGLFDITSGVLRKAWKFDGTAYTPNTQLIESLRGQIGWNKVQWDGKKIKLEPGMEIDFGGIGKEYAVDRVAEMLHKVSGATILVNFGGDIRAITSDDNSIPWIIGIEDTKIEDGAIGQIGVTSGAVATSGDVRRYCLVNGKRLGHILNPQSGWPQSHAPKSVTVLGDYCVEAGFLATLAMLHGADAEQFLKEQEVVSHCIR
jgi:thiamine biosynthesis lipoprotein